MKQLPIYTYGFDILRKKSTRITKVDDKLVEIVKNMFYTMDKAHGIGLAAPQVGKDIALTVIDISNLEGHEKEKPLVLINPKIIEVHSEAVMEEGCLSIPLLKSNVRRPDKIYIRYQDINLNEKFIELDSIFSRVAQHEIDHLNGILFIDHLDKEEKSRIKAHLKNIKTGNINVDYLLAEVKKNKKK
jgi:peptide deformylase